MVKKVRWSDKAISDRQGVFEANVEGGSLRFATKEDKKIANGVDIIRNNNFIGRDDLHPKGRLYSLPKRYKILYRLQDDFISIERVFH